MKAEPHSPPPFEDQPFVWPWVGVLANIPLQWKDGTVIGPSGFLLKQQLSRRGFNPLNVEILFSHRGHSGFALVEFEKDYQGLQDATLFDMSFQASHCGNKEWNNAAANEVCSEVKLYGWVAREVDYKFEGIVGQHLRRFRVVSNSNKADVSKRMCYNETMHSQVGGFSSCVEGLMKQKDEMVQRYHEDMRKTHQSAQKHMEKIISQREKVTVLLEAHKQEMEISTELVEGFVLNETELNKIQKEKFMIEEATLAQRKGDRNFLQLVEKHKQKEKEELHKKIIDFEKDVDEKHVFQLDIERMRGALRVMKHIGSFGDEEIIEKMDTIQRQLKGKEKEYKGLFESMNQALTVNQCLKEGSRNMSTRGVMKGQCIDSKPICAVNKRKYPEEKEFKKALDLCSEWSDYLEDSCKHLVIAERSSKEKIVLHDERSKCLRNENGDQFYNAGGKKKEEGANVLKW
ncbi:hypothetical protein RIF29_32056 [Crotalaria pallida]|uniref:XS domain-containing protein n=1 Tax=Crotalaria pallida TaxID=3830 RepID=A0AAN9HXI0_CROPI